MIFSLKRVSQGNISGGYPTYQESLQFISPLRQSGNSFQWNDSSTGNVSESLTNVNFQEKEGSDGRYYQMEGEDRRRQSSSSGVSFQKIIFSCEAEQSEEPYSQVINEIDSLQIGSQLTLDQPQTSMHQHIDSNRQEHSASISFLPKQFNEFTDIELSSMNINFTSKEQSSKIFHHPANILSQSIPRNPLLVLPASSLQQHDSQHFQSSFMLQGDCLLDLSYFQIIQYGEQQNPQSKCALNHWKQCLSVSKDRDQQNGLFFYSLESVRDYNPREQIEAAYDFLLKLKSLQLTNPALQEMDLGKVISRIQHSLKKEITFKKKCSQLHSEVQVIDKLLPTQQQINQERINQNIGTCHNLFSEDQTNEIRYIMKSTQELTGKMNSFLFGQVFSQNENENRQQQLVQLVYSSQLFSLIYPNSQADDLSTSHLKREGLFDFLDPRSRLIMAELQLRASFQVGFVGGESEESVVLITNDGYHLDADVIVKVKKLPSQSKLSMIIYIFKVKIKKQRLLTALRKEQSQKSPASFNSKGQHQSKARSGKDEDEDEEEEERGDKDLLLESQLRKKRKICQPSDQTNLRVNQSILCSSPEPAFLKKFYPELFSNSKRNV